jgi:sarcosine oxidase subunit beta
MTETRRTTTSGSRCLIIGAGILGCATALELARQGRDVLVVDAGPAAGSGSTGASSAIIRFHYSTWESVAIAWESYHSWIDWAGYLGTVDPAGMASYIRTGGLVLDPSGREADAVLSIFDDVGVPYVRLTPAAIRERFPAIDPGTYGPPELVESDGFWRDATGEMGGYLTPDAGYVDDPQLAAHNLMYAAMTLGAEFRFNVRVTDIVRSDGRAAGVVLNTGEHLSAGVVINVGGPASDLINQLAGVTEDMTVRGRPLRTETHVVPAPPGFEAGAGGVFVTDPDLGSAFRPQAGGFVHVSSIEPECDPLEWVEDPNDFDERPSMTRYEAQTYRVARRMPELTVGNRPQGLAALYDVTADWTAIYDCSSLPGFYMACGTSGNAFKNAPSVGRFMAALVSSCEDGHNHDEDPIAVLLPKTQRSVSLAPFSRLRVVGQDAPRNVIG